jgi:hypothetical protein
MLTPREQLLTGHDEFQRLVQEHSQYSQRLESLTQKRYLTDDEKLEEVRLKKLKLRLKDQMQNLESRFTGSLPRFARLRSAGLSNRARSAGTCGTTSDVCHPTGRA